MVRAFASLDDFRAIAGEEIGTGQWLTVTQDMINLFADATGDHQWIHVDPERAAHGPFGKPIAHGYLTLSLLPELNKTVYDVQGLTMGVNYGANKVRFPAPVPVNSRIRVTATLVGVSDIEIGCQLTIKCVVELEGSNKPACIAEVIYIMASA